MAGAVHERFTRGDTTLLTPAAMYSWDTGSLSWVVVEGSPAAGQDVNVTNFPASQAVTGPLTDAQLRATAVPVSGPLTDAQLRATAVPVSGTVTANQATAAGKTLTYVPVAQGAAGTTVLAAASPGNRHKIVGGMLTINLAGTFKFLDGSGDLTGAMDFAANGGFVIPASSFPFQQTAVNSALSLTTTVGAARGVIIILTEP